MSSQNEGIKKVWLADQTDKNITATAAVDAVTTAEKITSRGVSHIITR